MLAAATPNAQVDLDLLPVVDPTLTTFVDSIDGYQYRSVIQILQRKRVHEEIKYEIRKRCDDPLVGSVVEIKSTSGYIREIRKKDDVSEISNPSNARGDPFRTTNDRGNALNPYMTPDKFHFQTRFRGEDSVIDITSCHSAGSQSRDGNRSRESRMSTAQRAAMDFARNATRRLPPEEKDKTRQPLPARYVWDGRMGKFPEFQSQVEGHYGQVGAGYMFLEKFQNRYLNDGTKCWIYFTERVHSESQVAKDIDALYGALMTSCYQGVGKDIILRYSKSRDGLKAWIDMIERYKNGGDKRTKISKLEAIVATKFHNRYKGGLAQWVTDYETAFAELQALKVKKWSDEEDRLRTVLDNVAPDNSLESHVYKQMMEGKTLDQVFTDLRQFSI